MKKIGIDCRFASAHAGLGRYVREIVTHLLKTESEAAYKLFVGSADEPWIAELPYRPLIVEAPFAHYSVAEQTAWPAFLAKQNIELLFCPHFNVPYACPVPYVATVHDLILHRFPNEAGPIKRLAYRALMKRCVSKARYVVAVSDFTKRELLGAYPRLDASKIVTIPEAANDSFSPASLAEQDAVRDRFGLDKLFYLYVGNAKQHKNVPLLLEAYRSLGSTDIELVLVTGGKEAANLDLPDGARMLRDVDDVDMRALYSAAVCLVTASAYEGFCLPVVEARACGCKVIAPNATAIPEAAEGSATLLDVPVSVGSLAAALRNIGDAPTPSKPSYSWSGAAHDLARLLLSVPARSDG